MKAKKHLGQHFLIDALVIDKIVTAIRQNCPTDEAVLEVGPGRGAISFYLQDIYEQFKAVELDRDMITYLSQRMDAAKLLHLDFLKADLSKLFGGTSFNLVGNFPYNISSQIVFKLLENRTRIPVMLGMFQRELADRICAEPGGKANGILSILSQLHYSAEKLFDIAPEAFDPAPKVFSSVILLRRKKELDDTLDLGLYKRIVKQAFSQRRKKMRNTLKSFDLQLEDSIFQKRPEQLGVEDFIKIVKSIEK